MTTMSLQWPTLRDLRCKSREAHLWSFSLNCRSSVPKLANCLSQEELARSAQFSTTELCNRWIIARGAMRCILANYSGTSPRSLKFHRGPHGKPYLVAPSDDLQFNLSHSGDRALLAVTRNRRVGVDLERVDPRIDIEILSRHFFAPEEVAELFALPLEDRIASFFVCWTRKEAFVKALGVGLSRPLDRFRVTVKPGDPPAILRSSWDESAQWTLQDVAQPGIAAAIAIEGPAPQILHIPFQPPL